MTDSPSGIPQAPVAPPATKNALDRMAGVLFAPAETFEDIARRPNFVAPLLLIFITSTIFAVILAPKLDFDTMIREQMAQSGRQMSDSDMEQAVRIGGAFTKALTYASPIFGIAMIAIVAGVLLMAFRLMGGEGTYKQAFSVSLHAWLPYVIAGVIGSIILFTRESIAPDLIPTLVRSNLGFLADPREQGVLFALLSSFDIFTIWVLALFSIGFSYVSRMAKGKSAAIVVSLWVILLIFKLGFAFLGSMRAGA